MSLIQSSIIPAARIASVESALGHVFNTSDITNIALLSGGLSDSSVYKISVSSRAYILKLSNTGDTAAAFSANLTLAATAGIAPSVHYLDKSQGICVSDFVNNIPVHGVFTPDKLTRALADTIKAIHSIPAVSNGNDLLETVDALINRFKKSEMLSGQVFREFFQYHEVIKEKYPWKHTDRVFSHNDLNPGNILCDGERIWIIDWDVAASNDRYVDLATAANFFIYSEKQETEFLNFYFDNIVDDYKIARFYIMRQICRVVYAMLMFQLARQNKPVGYLHNHEMQGIDLKAFGALMGAGKLSLADYEGQIMYGKALFNEAVHQMRTPRFASSLANLA